MGDYPLSHATAFDGFKNNIRKVKMIFVTYKSNYVNQFHIEQFDLSDYIFLGYRMLLKAFALPSGYPPIMLYCMKFKFSVSVCCYHKVLLMLLTSTDFIVHKGGLKDGTLSPLK